MFVPVVAPKEALFGKAAKARRVRPSEDSVADQERDAAVAPARVSWSLRNFLLSSPAGHGQPNSGGTGKPGGTRHLELLPLLMQAKLEVGTVDDPLEREADRVAAQVARMPVSEPASDSEDTSDGSPKAHAANPSASGHAVSLQRKCACGGTCDSCKAERVDDEHGKLQRKVLSVSSSELSTAAPAIVHEVLSEPGDPLDAATRAFFEPRFERDFSQVRVHSDARASASARAVNARAYTVANHIVFRSGEFNRSGTRGQALIAHELAHVVQQEASSSAAFAKRGAAMPPQSNVLRRQPADKPDEPLDVALARQDLLDKIAETAGKIREQLDAARVDTAEREAKIAPFFVQEDPQVQRLEQQIASGRTQVPARLAKLRESLRTVGREALRESDDLDQIRAKIANVELLNSFIPSLLRDTSEYEALLKKQKTGERDYAETIAFFDGIRKQIELTKRFLPERAAYLKQRSQFLETQGRSAAKTAKVDPDTRASIDQLALLRTIIEASPTLRPYLTEERAKASQPTDLRNTQKFIIHSSDSDLQDEAQRCHQGEAEPGTKIGGFYCRQTDTIHLPPDAKFGHALHESVHKYSKLVLKGVCSQFLNEGVTQYFADIVLADQGFPKFTGHAYQKQLECAARFIDRFHLDQVASVYFLGVAGLGTGSLHPFLQSRQCGAFCAPEQGSARD